MLNSGMETNGAGRNTEATINEPWEDDDLRSRHVRRLIHGTEGGSPRRPRGSEDIPRMIVPFWHDRAELPEDVRACLESWHALENEGFSIVLFDDEEARRFIAGRFGDSYSRAYDFCYHQAVLHQSPDKRGVPLPVKMVSQLTQTWHSQVRSFC